MTSDVERVVEQAFLFHCSCGVTIETSEKKEICRNCGETVEVRRWVATADGKKYSLRISKHRHRLSKEPQLWPVGPMPQPAVHSNETRRRTGHHLVSLDYNERFLRAGLLTLLAPLYLPLALLLVLCVAPVQVEQDQPHHYVRHDVRVYDERGVHTVRRWERVND
jgi:hypothetical protein